MKQFNQRVLNKAQAFAENKRVMTTISIPNAKAQDVDKYRKLYGKKAIYKRHGIQYVKPFIRVQAMTPQEI
tara:strand:- start:1368 stop:1580 length:213 start_codon:yes stop_codon:yes gene_type:complete